ncbi:hypothetical protein [Nocardiopsis rhodophaea]
MYGDVTVSYDPRLPFLQRFTVRGLDDRLVRLPPHEAKPFVP